MSFLEKEEPKQSAFWDWVVGIGLVLVIGGFTVYYQYQKRSSLTRFEAADQLYKAKKFKEAGKAYDELKSAQYLTTHNDSTIYARMDTVESIREQQGLLITQSKAKRLAGDTLASRQVLSGIIYPDLLSDEDRPWWDSIMVGIPPATKP